MFVLNVGVVSNVSRRWFKPVQVRSDVRSREYSPPPAPSLQEQSQMLFQQQIS